MNRPGLVSGLIIDVVDAAWSVVDDFAPSRTLREVAAHLEEMRKSRFDAKTNAHAVRLEAHASALRRSLAVISHHRQAGTASTLDDAAAVDLESRLHLIVDLLHPAPDHRDTFGGTAGGTRGPQDPAFATVGAHGTVLATATSAANGVATKVFGSVEAQRRESARHARVAERLRTVEDMSSHLADAAVLSGDASVAATHRLLNDRLTRERQAADYARRALAGGGERPPSAAAPAAAAVRRAPEPLPTNGRRRVRLD